jgi:hypothetical protein
MTKNYFAVECNGQYIDHVVIRNDNGDIMFEDLTNATYDEMKGYSALEEFVAVVAEVTEAQTGSIEDHIALTLVGEDDVFIWGILIGPGEDDELRYVLVDWKKDGKSFKYADDEKISEN